MATTATTLAHQAQELQRTIGSLSLGASQISSAQRTFELQTTHATTLGRSRDPAIAVPSARRLALLESTSRSERAMAD